MTKSVIPPSSRPGPTGRQLFLTVQEYELATHVQWAIQGEVGWLRTAWGCYPEATYTRMVKYSSDRLHYVIANQLGIPCECVLIQVLVGNAPDIRVQIGWVGNTGRRLLWAWNSMNNPSIQA